MAAYTHTRERPSNAVIYVQSYTANSDTQHRYIFARSRVVRILYAEYTCIILLTPCSWAAFRNGRAQLRRARVSRVYVRLNGARGNNTQ